MPLEEDRPDGAIGLEGLNAQLARELDRLNWPALPWMRPALAHADGDGVVDVAIVGGGQAGLAAAAALQRHGIQAVVFDRAPQGFEGPWATTARMQTLRTPKTLTGPALGVPSLTFRAWFEAQFGFAAWDALELVPRLQWMAYLRWFREVLALDLRNGCTLVDLQPDAEGVTLTLRTPEGRRLQRARRVVLATGRDGLGGPVLPPFLQGLPRQTWAHSSDAWDPAQLQGRRVAVVGAGASAMDSAAAALEAGAERVDLLVRRPDIPRIHKSRSTGAPGLVHGHPLLSDAQRWQLRHSINSAVVPPPRPSTLRVSRHPNAHFHVGSPVLSVRQAGDALRVRTPQGELAAHFLVVSTGFQVDWSRRPEFMRIAPHVRSWRERYTPPAGRADEDLANSPDLGPAFEFQARDAQACPGLERVHCFCWPALLSHGAVCGDVPAISEGARRLADGLAALFYREDFEHHFGRLQAFDEPELTGDEWRPAAEFPYAGSLDADEPSASALTAPAADEAPANITLQP